MAKSAITRVQALDFAIANLDNQEVVEVLAKMRESLAKPRKKSDAPSKARVENLALVDAACAAIGDNVVTPKWLTEHVNGILTTQKAAAVMRLGVEVGKIEKVVDGRNVTYKVA